MSADLDIGFFTGNYPPEISIEATWLDGSPSHEELAAALWMHIRLNIYPDGEIADCSDMFHADARQLVYPG